MKSDKSRMFYIYECVVFSHDSLNIGIAHIHFPMFHKINCNIHYTFFHHLVFIHINLLGNTVNIDEVS